VLFRLLQSPEDRTGVRRATLTALVIALLAGTTAAFALTEALKLDRTGIAVRRFERVVSPACRCPARTATFVVSLRAADTIDVEIIDAEGKKVRVLAAGLERPPGIVTSRWAGRDDAGGFVPEGTYRLRIRLRDEDQTIVIPRTIRVAAPPSP
jgi:FlgD Ig-like domain